MIRRKTLKKFIAIFISSTILLNLIGLKHTKIKKIKRQIHNIRYRANKELYDDIYRKWVKPSEEKELEEQKKKQNILSKENLQEEIFILTFYTSLDNENGYGTITCTRQKLRDGIVANNVLPIGTKIYLERYGEVIVGDHGGNNFNTENRLDVFVSRKNGESNYQYKRRVENMGVMKVKGKIIN